MHSIKWDNYHQLLAIFLHVFVEWISFALVPCYVISLWLYPWLWCLAIPYICWIYYDTQIAFNCGRRSDWFTELPIFKHFREYFFAKLIKTADLPPNRNYLMVQHPHSVFPATAISHFFSNIPHFKKLYPGLDVRTCTLDALLYLPVFREYLLAVGCCSTSKISLQRLLNSKTPRAIVLLAGAAAEASILRSGNKIEIVTRKGFIREALQSGTYLVPVFAFGENNIVDLHDVSSFWLKPFRIMYSKYLRMRFIWPKGRGFFQNSFGFLPRRVKLNTVVGEPIPVPKVDNPSDELIEEYKKKFYDALVDLFEQYKEQYDMCGKDAQLILH